MLNGVPSKPDELVEDWILQVMCLALEDQVGVGASTMSDIDYHTEGPFGSRYRRELLRAARRLLKRLAKEQDTSEFIISVTVAPEDAYMNPTYARMFDEANTERLQNERNPTPLSGEELLHLFESIDLIIQRQREEIDRIESS